MTTLNREKQTIRNWKKLGLRVQMCLALKLSIRQSLE